MGKNQMPKPLSPQPRKSTRGVRDRNDLCTFMKKLALGTVQMPLPKDRSGRSVRTRATKARAKTSR
jgi:hypothetical protein